MKGLNNFVTVWKPFYAITLQFVFDHAWNMNFTPTSWFSWFNLFWQNFLSCIIYTCRNFCVSIATTLEFFMIILFCFLFIISIFCLLFIIILFCFLFKITSFFLFVVVLFYVLFIISLFFILFMNIIFSCKFIFGDFFVILVFVTSDCENIWIKLMLLKIKGNKMHKLENWLISRFYVFTRVLKI